MNWVFNVSLCVPLRLPQELKSRWKIMISHSCMKLKSCVKAPWKKSAFTPCTPNQSRFHRCYQVPFTCRTIRSAQVTRLGCLHQGKRSVEKRSSPGVWTWGKKKYPRSSCACGDIIARFNCARVRVSLASYYSTETATGRGTHIAMLQMVSGVGFSHCH